MRLKVCNILRTRTKIARLRLIRPSPGAKPSTGYLAAGDLCIPCVIGAAGVVHLKREGDRGTPAGRMRVLKGYFRSDRISQVISQIPMRPLTPLDTWCDDAQSFSYNRHAFAPVRHKHEHMWLADGVYDVVFVLDYNIRPRVRGLGSAIFFHLTRPDRSPTAGCIAINLASMRHLIPRLSRHVVFIIQ